ncbi:MAG: PAS domain S-box protein [Betaproteobacteria bacterium]
MIAVCMLVIGGVWTNVLVRAAHGRADALASAVKSNDNLAIAFEQYAVRTLENADDVLHVVQREYARKGRRTDLDALMLDLGISSSAFQGIGIIDEHGDLVMTTMSPRPANVNFTDREHFKVHQLRDTGHVFVGKPVVSHIPGKASIPITRRINTPEGQFAGIVVVQIDPARFTEFYRHATLADGDIVSIVGLDGIIRSRLTGGREEFGVDVSASPLIARLAKERTGNYSAIGAIDGVQRLYSFRTLRDYSLAVMTGKAEANVLAAHTETQRRVHAIAAAATAFLISIAILLIVTLERKKHAVEALASREERLRATFNQAAVGIAHTRLDGLFLQVNQKFCDIVGYSPEELLALKFIDIVHGDDIASTRQQSRQLLHGNAGDAAPEREVRFVRKDGALVWCLISGSAVRNGNGDIEHFVAIVQDISTRKDSEEQLRRVARARRVMADCNRVLVHATDEGQMLREMCSTLVGPGGYRLVRVGLIEHDDEKNVRVVAQAGLAAEELGELRWSWGDGERGRGTAGRAIRTGRPAVVGDILADPTLALWHAQARQHGFSSVASLPLTGNGETIGVVTINALERNAFDVQEIALLKEMAADMGFGILALRMRLNHARAEASLRISQERFRRYFELGRVGMAITSPSKGCMEVNDQLCTILGYERAELLATTWVGLTHPDDLARDVEQFDRIVSGEIEGYSLDKRFIRKDGRVIDATIAVRCVRGFDGAVDYMLAQVEDITERRRQEASVKRLSQTIENQYRIFNTALSSISDQAYIVDRDGRFVYANQALLTVVGMTLEEVVGRGFSDMHVTDAQAARLLLQVRQVFADKCNITDELHYVGLRGFTADFEYILHPVFAPDGSVELVTGSTRDITGRKRTENGLRLQADLLAAVGQAVVATDLAGSITYSNRPAELLFGWTSAEMAGRNIFDVAPTELSRSQVAEIAGVLPAGGSWTGEYQFRRRDGSSIPLQVALSPIHDESGALIGTIGVHSDITERKAYERQIEYLATHDALTDLPNRNLFNDRLTHAVGHAQRSGTSVGIIFLDVDHFKFVNDGFGHPVGDAVLKAIAQRLRGLVRDSDTVARLGGDEFVILLTDLKDTLLGASKVAQAIVDSFAQPFLIEGREFAVTMSMGISLYPQDGRELDELLRDADAAMYRAKEMGRNGYQFYASEMSIKATQRLTLDSSMRQALSQGQFSLHYQPLIVISTGEITGMEALIRWQHPQLGMVAPDRFIPLAEENGLIIPIGEWVLRTACAQNKAWQDSGMSAMTVAVNLSALQLMQPGFVELVARVLDETGLAPRCLNLELTESLMIGSAGPVIAILNRLRALGVTLSMDDFGTGYSNLGYLAHLPLDILKIDRSFVRDLPTHKGAGSVARAIVSMGRGLGIRIVAEGVETIEQAEFLESIGCEQAQGFLYSKPLPADAFAPWVRLHGRHPACVEPAIAYETEGAV